MCARALLKKPSASTPRPSSCTHFKVVVSQVGEQLSVKPLVNDVAEIGHRDVLIDTDDIVFGAICWSLLAQP